MSGLRISMSETWSEHGEGEWVGRNVGARLGTKSVVSKGKKK